MLSIFDSREQQFPAWGPPKLHDKVRLKDESDLNDEELSFSGDQVRRVLIFCGKLQVDWPEGPWAWPAKEVRTHGLAKRSS